MPYQLTLSNVSGVEYAALASLPSNKGSTRPLMPYLIQPQASQMVQFLVAPPEMSNLGRAFNASDDTSIPSLGVPASLTQVPAARGGMINPSQLMNRVPAQNALRSIYAYEYSPFRSNFGSPSPVDSYSYTGNDNDAKRFYNGVLNRRADY